MGKKICVIGCGMWGENHIRTLKEIGCLGAVVDINYNRLKDIRDKYDVDVYDSLDDAISFGYDGYDLVTSAETHYEIGKKLLSKGLPCIIEKPMTMNSAEAEDLVNIAKTNNTSFMVAHILLFHPAINKIKEFINEGKIGRIYYMYSTRIKFGVVRTEENVYESFAPHDLAILNYFVGSSAEKITLHKGFFLQNDICDYVLAYLEYPNNIKAHINVSWIHPFKEQRVVVVGSEGMLWFDDAGDKQVHYSKKSVDFSNVIKPGDLPLLLDNDEEIISIDYSDLPLTRELKYFVSHLDVLPEYSTGYDGWQIVKSLEESRE